MVNQTISLVIEESDNNIFIKPSPTSEEINITESCHRTTATFNPIHACNEECNCILHFKNHYFKMDKIVHLNLSRCKLNSLPDALSNLPLKSLNLSHNNLKCVPPCLLTNLDMIEDLNLSYNNIIQFETEPKCAANLKRLDLKSNGMQYVPIWIVHVKCQSLHELDYSDNSLGDTSENLHGEIYSYCLQKVILRNASVLNKNIPFIKSIQTIKYLDVSNSYEKTNKNSFTSHETFFDNPEWKNSIEVLELSSLNFGFLPAGMACLNSLKELYLSCNELSWLPDLVGNLLKLEILDLSNNCICTLPNTFNNLKNLRILRLQYNNLSEVTALKDLVRLELLDLYKNVLDSFDLDVHHYKYLDLENNHFETGACLGDEYRAKMENYRRNFNLLQRQTGVIETYFDSDSESSENHSKYTDFEENWDEPNVPPVESYVEECWDYETYKSHPEVTPSDDEWQGHILIEKPKVKLSKKFSREHLLDDLYADAD